MIAAVRPERRSAKLVVVDVHGGMRHLPRAELASLFRSGDVVIANDAATLPASLTGHIAQAASQLRSGLRRGCRSATRHGSRPSRSARAIIARVPRTGHLRRHLQRATASRSGRSLRSSILLSTTHAFSDCGS